MSCLKAILLRLDLRESLLYLATRLLARCDRRARDMVDYRPADVRNILLVSTTALGDAVLSTAAMAAMRRSFPAARLAALIHRDYVPLFREADFLDAVIAYHGGWRRFFCTLRTLRAAQPDLALILHGNEPQATPLAYLAGARFIFKLPNTSRFSFLLTNREPRRGWADFRHGIEARLEAVRLAGARIEDARMCLPLPAAAHQRVESWLAQHGVNTTNIVIGLQAGASSRGRMWPVEHFIALARLLLAAHPACRFIVIGAPRERARCEAIVKGVGATAITAAGALPIEALPALVARCAVLVTGDTGTLHVAVAVGTPTVALFAVSDPAASGPAHDLERHIVIQRPAPAGVRSKTDDDRWMARIAPEEAAAAVMRQLERGEPSHG